MVHTAGLKSPPANFEMNAPESITFSSHFEMKETLVIDTNGAWNASRTIPSDNARTLDRNHHPDGLAGEKWLRK
jgi:hypothetical protein